jgi:hypothetical protein
MNTDFQKYLMNALNEVEKDETNPTPTNGEKDNKDKLTAETFKKDLIEAETEESLKDIFKRFNFKKGPTAIYEKDGESVELSKKDLENIFKNLINNDEFMEIFTDKFRKDSLKIENNDSKNDFLKFFDEIKAKFQKKIENNNGTLKRKEDFEKLGETIVYRTACAFKNPDANIETICKEIFSDDSDDRIKSLGSIESKFAEYGCLKGFAEYKKKNEKSNKEDVKNTISKLTPYYEVLQNQGSSPDEVNDAIEEISSNIKTEFKHFYDEAQASFEEGQKTMKDHINDPNWKWVDPLTGKEPKGNIKNTKAVAKKLFSNMAQKADELSKKIMSSPHNLENDILKAGVIAIKVAVGGVKAVKAIANFFGFGKTASADAFIKKNKETTNSTKSALNKFKNFLKDTRFDKLFKEGFNESFRTLKNVFKFILNEEDTTAQTTTASAEASADTPAEEPKTNPGELSEELNKLRLAFMNEDNGFKKTGNTIFNYIIKSYAYLVLLANGTDKNKIGEFKKVKDATDTYEFNFNLEGNITYIQDKINLYINSINIFNDFYNELKKKNEKTVNKLFVGDILQSEQIFPISSYKLIKCIDSLVKDPDLSKNKIFVDNLNAIKKLYDKNGIFQFTSNWIKIKENPNGWSSNGKTLEELYKQLQITLNTLKSIKIQPETERIVKTFKNKEDFDKFKKELVNALGGDKNIEYTNGDTDSSNYNSILNKLNDFDKIDNLKNAITTMLELKTELPTAIEEINKNTKIPDNLKSTYEGIKDKNDVFINAMYLKAAMASMNESYWFNNGNLLTEDEHDSYEDDEDDFRNSNVEQDRDKNNNVTKWIEQFKKMFDNVTPDNFKSNVDEYNKLIKDIDETYETVRKSNQKYNGVNPDCAFEKAVYMKTPDKESNENSGNEVEETKKNLPEEEAKKALDNMVVNVEGDKIKVKTTFNGWKGKPDKLDVYIYSNKDIDQQIHAAASPFYHAYQEAYRDLFDKWCEETEKGTDENKKKAIPLLKKLLGDKVEDHQEDSIEIADELKKQFDAVSQELEKLKEINGDSAKLDKIDELSKKLEEIDGKIQTTYDELWKIVQTKNNKDEFKQYEINKDKTPVFQKIINVKAIMAKLGITESVVINEIKQLLLEETENKELDNVKKELKDLLDKKFEDGDLKKYDEIKSNIEKIEGVPEEIKEKPELTLALGDKESEGNKEDESKIDTYVKETKAIIDGINIENISKEDFYNKLKTAFDKTEDGILEWCKNDEKRLELYTRHELPSEIKDDIIPKLWNAKSFLSTVYKEIKQESFNPFYDYDFIMLLEAENEQNTEGDGKESESEEDKKKKLEEITNKVKNGCEAINKLLTVEKENDFVSQYKEWKNGATELFNQFGDKIENKDQMKDPTQMMTGMCIALKKANEGGEKPAEGGEKQEGNQETGQEGGQESNKEGENNQQG